MLSEGLRNWLGNATGAVDGAAGPFCRGWTAMGSVFSVRLPERTVCPEIESTLYCTHNAVRYALYVVRFGQPCLESGRAALSSDPFWCRFGVGVRKGQRGGGGGEGEREKQGGGEGGERERFLPTRRGDTDNWLSRQ
jgi:hypothetical protein